MIKNNWEELGEKLDVKRYREGLRNALFGQRHMIVIGRSRNTAGFANGTPIEVVDGADPPQLRGLPFLSTTFTIGSFTKTLYTPSTLHVVVGKDWRP